MAFDFSRLRGRITEKYGTCEGFARAMHRSKRWLSARLNNTIHWQADDIHRACELLGIPAAEIPAYFFVPKFRLTEEGGNHE